MLRELRERRGVTQEWVADKAGVDPSTVSKLENGGRRPSVQSLEAVLNALGASHKERSLALAHVASPASKAA